MTVLITAQQKKMAELLVEGESTITDCYIQAYKPNEKDLEDKQKIYQRAYSASLSKGVKEWVAKLQEQQAIEEARILVWDKRKATKRLLQMCHEIEVNIKITRELRDKLLNDEKITDAGKLNQMLKVAQICNDTSRAIKECIQEMNQMYGLTKPEVNLTNAVQVIIGGAEELPEDTID